MRKVKVSGFDFANEKVHGAWGGGGAGALNKKGPNLGACGVFLNFYVLLGLSFFNHRPKTHSLPEI